MVGYNRRRPRGRRRPHEGGPVRSRKELATEAVTLSRHLKRFGGGDNFVEACHRFGRDRTPRRCRQHKLLSFCEMIRTMRCGSNRELRRTTSAGVDVVAALQQVTKDGQELGFPELVQSHT